MGIPTNGVIFQEMDQKGQDVDQKIFLGISLREYKD